MKAYAYFDQHGTLKEFIIDPSVRQGNNNVNEIMIYMEDDWNGYITGDSTVDTIEVQASLKIYTTQEPTPVSQFNTLIDDIFYVEKVPAMKDYDPKFFKYGKDYNFIKYTIPSEALAVSGNARVNIILFDTDEGVEVLFFGMIPFSIEETTALPAVPINWSEYLYLLGIANSVNNKINKSGLTFISNMTWRDTNGIDALTYNVSSKLFTLQSNLCVGPCYFDYYNNGDFYIGDNDFNLYLDTYGAKQLSLKDGELGLLNDHFLINYNNNSKPQISVKNGNVYENLLINSANITLTDSAFTWNGKNVATENYVVNITNALDTRITAIEDIIPTGASSSNKLVTESFVTSALTPLANRVTTIESYIPSQTSASNQLADKAFVNSSISTNTANFLGTYNVVTDLGLTISATHAQVEAKLDDLNLDPTNNDYVFVSYPDSTDPTQYTKFERYKYNADDDEWGFEYELNNSSFTSAQWAAINSGITDVKVSAYDAHLANMSNPHGVTASQVGLGNVDNTSDATKKTNFTGSIASGNSGFVIGGDVYSALALKADITYVNNYALAMSVVNDAFTEITIEED